MKRLLVLVLSIVIVFSLLMAGCGTDEPSSTTTTATSTPGSGDGTPKSGGTLRVLWQTGISNLSYIPEQSMTDEALSKAYAETLVYYSGSGDFKPELAKSWEIDETDKTLTFYLEEGVKFHDGTDFNAEAVRWNVQKLIDSQRLANGQYVDSIEVVGEYTFRYNLNAMLTPQIMLHSYGYNLLTMFSPTAFDTNGGRDWAVSNYVSTAAFKFDSWTQDVSLKIVKFDDYWRGSEYPYLDAIEFIFVADQTIASAKLQAGEADAWGGPALKEATDLEAMGYNLIIGIGGFYAELIPDNVSEGSYYKDPKVRQALEYAIDREGMAIGLGYGKLKPVMQAGGPEYSQGYNPDFEEREYDTEKAKELLADAGFPNGFKTTLLVMQGAQQDMAQNIQASLADVGIEAEIDVADPGRFIGSIYQGGWNGGLLLWMVPIDPEFVLGWFVHFGPQPIFPYPSLQWPDEYRDLVEKVRLAPTVEEMRAATMEMMTFVSEGAYVIPLIDSLNLYVVEDYVKTNRLKDHFMVWHTYEDWLDK